MDLAIDVEVGFADSFNLSRMFATWLCMHLLVVVRIDGTGGRRAREMISTKRCPSSPSRLGAVGVGGAMRAKRGIFQRLPINLQEIRMEELLR